VRPLRTATVPLAPGRGPARWYGGAVAEREASCSCGQLRATVKGDPVRVSICHCLACQRRTGSSYGYQARWPSGDVQISGRSTEFVRHSDEEGEIRRFNFCPECGTTVFYTTGDDTDLIAIAVGAFADPSFPAPTISVWEERRHSWVVPPPEAEHIF
jgi:hypothetical protein